jgi:hypothetical protein
MAPYLHRVVGLYPSLDLARQARDLMMARGLPSTQIRVLTAGAMGAVAAAGADAAAAPLPHDARPATLPVS